MDIKKTSEYIDLNLPSETLWKTHNEDGFFTYDDAIKTFGDTLPTDEQFKELIEECEWEWQGDGYEVTGRNGNYIFLPAYGWQEDPKNTRFLLTKGGLWSRTSLNKHAWDLVLSNEGYDLSIAPKTFGQSVRLVK